MLEDLRPLQWILSSIVQLDIALTREISSWTREDKIHIRKRACRNILFIIETPVKYQTILL